MRLLIVLSIALFVSCKHECGTTCENGGACIDGSCACPPGFIGDRCQFKDTCLEKKCGNNGTLANCKCDCLPTFYGRSCENSMLEGKSYVVKNLFIHPDEMFYLSDYLKENDILTASTTVYSSTHLLVVFYNHKRAISVNAEAGNTLRFFENRNSGSGYSDYNRGKIFNNGDSIHMVLSRSWKTPNIPEREVVIYDLIRQ